MGSTIDITDSSQLLSNVLGLESNQSEHVFGSVNEEGAPLNATAVDEIEMIEKCLSRVQHLIGESSEFLSSLDEESWGLISSWRGLYSGLKSRHCMVAGFINGTNSYIQVKAANLIQGGSLCYRIPTGDYNESSGLLGPGAAIMFFGWGLQPTLKHEGQIIMSIETNAFYCTLMNKKSPMTTIETGAGYQCLFLERSIADWWAKYWVVVKSTV